MFSLMFGLWKWFFSRPEYRAVVLGLDNAGKTTMLEQLKNQYCKGGGMALEKITPTVGLNIGRFDIGGCKLLVWDLGGQANLRKIWEKYYSETHALIFVLDAADPERYQEAYHALSGILENQALGSVPILVLVNKIDKEHALRARDLMPRTGIDALLGAHRRPQPNGAPSPLVRVADVCALTGEGLQDGMQWLVAYLKANVRVEKVVDD
eukprot:TRINITY_DN98886_c0_g1_i1.p1 TRINITY_DN98886_c0_g1~~TRINITY_DN98886_c0_g1_i1.p1  ORF type:complete len:209 (-),score=45.06 TRINITY_DN98886_c0_g1_i1:12-638(-)